MTVTFIFPGHCESPLKEIVYLKMKTVSLFIYIYVVPCRLILSLVKLKRRRSEDCADFFFSIKVQFIGTEDFVYLFINSFIHF